MDKSKSKTGLQYQKNLPYITEVQWDISDLPFLQNKYLEVELSPSSCIFSSMTLAKLSTGPAL